ncbi:hypothetical protein Pst134EA_032966 [Puccinia striiformis f. sp. tritici]|nr:uncharacterized protein Pst134EA_032966 [Puccinia striiformis f. sp. tritici]KAH9443477.1 hypothetical protein Pst134EA_032966 [Puccinia striiformis f. sp. tritici]
MRRFGLTISKDNHALTTRNLPDDTGRYIDHFINSPSVLKRVEKVQVDTVSSSVSDHWPVVQFQNNELVNVATKPTPVKAWNRKALQGHGMELALSDRWDVFKSDNIENEGDLNEVAHQWVETLNTIGEELGMLAVPKEQQAFEFDRKTKALVKRARRSRKALEKADPNLSPGAINKLRAIRERDSNIAKMAVRKFARAEKKKKSQRINSLLLNNEAADFHRTLQREQGKSQEKQDNMPCFDEDERLVTEPKDILAARASYSEALAADPTGISQTPDRWRHVPRFGGEHEPLHIMRPLPPGVKFRDDEKDRVSPPLEADAFLMAIRQIQRNAAPGKDGVLAMHLKKFLQIECQLAISKEWKGCPKNYFGKNSYPQPLDYSTVAVDRWSLPAELSTPPLKHLLNIMRGCLTLKTQPRSWNEEILITLPKPGQDQRWLKNTRGITLSCTQGKLLLTIIASEIASKLEARQFFSDAQAGGSAKAKKQLHM